MAKLARDNRQFLTRAVEYMAFRGVRQFLDVGSGLPTRDNTHQVAQAVNPDARVVYADNDRCKPGCAHELGWPGYRGPATGPDAGSYASRPISILRSPSQRV
jgi:hypothetical protein